MRQRKREAYGGIFRTALIACFGIITTSATVSADENETLTAQAKQSLQLATRFMSDTVAKHGGYAWVSSPDGRLSHGEGVAGKDRVWVQPPGTPAVGTAFLAAYRATGDTIHLDAARAAGEALLQGQLRSGGWGYSIEFDPKQREEIPYRTSPGGRRADIPHTPDPGGWAIWRQRRYRTNRTLIDDDTTPAAIRFLIQLDQTLDFEDQTIHEAASYALQSTLNAQYPIGAWSHNYDRFPLHPPSVQYYPVISASLPKQWSRRTTDDFTGCYTINDRATMNMIKTMLMAWDLYGDERYRTSAVRGGDFLLRAQLPEPQPAWAQQYNRQMQPVWDRKFEPPAITGLESQDVIRTLLLLTEKTGERRFLQPIPLAIEYLKSSRRPDGTLSRYYELGTNRPLYFNRDYELTYEDSDVPDHYRFVAASHLDGLSDRYVKISGEDSEASTERRDSPDRVEAADRERVAQVIASQRDDGAWLTPGFVRDEQARKVKPAGGVVDSAVFIAHAELLSEFIRNSATP